MAKYNTQDHADVLVMTGKWAKKNANLSALSDDLLSLSVVFQVIFFCIQG